MKRLIFSQICLLVLASCGGSSGGGGGGVTTISSQFIDSPVKGLNVVGNVSGASTTAAEGRFNCRPQETVTFKLRDLVIGSAVCGSRVYLDDVADAAVADKLAVVIQSLSTTAASSGEIDLSSIPANAAVAATIDLTGNEAAIHANLVTLKATVPAVTFEPNITVAAARAHVNSNLPTLDADAVAELDGFIASAPYIKATRTSGDAEHCWQYYSAKVVITKPTTAYKAQLIEIYGSDTAPIKAADCTLTMQNNEECADDGGFIDEQAKIITGSTVTFASNEKQTWSIISAPVTVGSDTYIAGSVKVVAVDLANSVNNITDYFTFSDGSTDYPIQAVGGNFPFESEMTSSISLTYGADGFTGNASLKSLNISMTDYTNPTTYTLDTEDSECKYTISDF